MPRSIRRLLVLLLGAAVLAVGASSAHAAMTSRATATPTVTSASWGVTPAGVDGTGSPSLTWNIIDGFVQADRYFTVVNTGTTRLTGTTWSVTVSRTGSNGNVPPVRFDACVGAAWNTSADTCAGTITTIGTTADKVGTLVVASSVTAANVGSVLSVRAVPTAASINQSMSAVVTTTVSSATQVHAPNTVTNS